MEPVVLKGPSLDHFPFKGSVPRMSGFGCEKGQGVRTWPIERVYLGRVLRPDRFRQTSSTHIPHAIERQTMMAPNFQLLSRRHAQTSAPESRVFEGLCRGCSKTICPKRRAVPKTSTPQTGSFRTQLVNLKKISTSDKAAFH